MAGHADPRTTQLYDRRKQLVTRSEVERIRYETEDVGHLHERMSREEDDSDYTGLTGCVHCLREH
jgi:stress response protein YsnF